MMGMLPVYSADSKKDAATSSRRALDCMYRIRAAVFSSTSLVVILASVGVVNRATIASYAGTSLYQVFVRSSDLVLAENYALAAVGLVAIVLLALDLATSHRGKAEMLSPGTIGRLHILAGAVVPALAQLSYPDGHDFETRCVIFTACSSIQNTLYLNGFLSLVSTASTSITDPDTLFNIAWTAPCAAIYAVAAVLGIHTELSGSSPDDPLAQTASALYFPIYLVPAVAFCYVVLVVGSLLYRYHRHRASSANIPPPPLPLEVVSKLLWSGCALAVVVCFAIVGENSGSGSSRDATFPLVKSYFFLSMTVLILLTVVSPVLKSQLALSRSSGEVRLLTANAKLREGMSSMLREMLPPHVYQQLCHPSQKASALEPQTHDFVTVFFCDIEGFTSFSSGRSAMEVLALVTRLFAVIDGVCAEERFAGAMYKVETVGDSWLGVGGLGKPAVTAEERRALAITTAQFALAVREAVAKVPLDDTRCVRLRIGLHAGPIVTGVVGNFTPRFCVFGDIINTASRMETTGRPGRVHASEDFATLIDDAPGLVCLARHPFVMVKGKGEMRTFWVESFGGGNGDGETKEGESAVRKRAISEISAATTTTTTDADESDEGSTKTPPLNSHTSTQLTKTWSFSLVRRVLATVQEGEDKDEDEEKEKESGLASSTAGLAAAELALDRIL